MLTYEIIGREGVPVADDFHHISIGNLVSPLVVDRLTGIFYTLKSDRTVVALGVSASAAAFLAAPSSANLAALVTDETGSGALVFANSPTLVTPALGTPSSGTLTNCGGLPVSSGVAGLASGAATFLATPSSANLAALLTDETGSGAAVFANSPTLVTPALGTPASGVLTNCTGTAAGLTAGNVTTNANLTGPITSSGNATAVAAQTGTGSTFVMSMSPTLVTPDIGAATVTGSVATPANGSTSARLLFGTTAGFGIYYGSLGPTVSAAKGSLYLRSDGDATNNRIYVNTDGGTTWTHITTGA